MIPTLLRHSTIRGTPCWKSAFWQLRSAKSISSVQRPPSIALRYASSRHSITQQGGVKSTLPSTTDPNIGKRCTDLSKDGDDGDRGYLAFTKASLFKLTLPLQPPSSDPDSPFSKNTSEFSKAQEANRAANEHEETQKEAAESATEDTEPWEMRADAGQSVSQVSPKGAPQANSNNSGKRVKATTKEESSSKPAKRLGLHGPEMGEPADNPACEFDAKAPAHSVVFLLHSGQPLSYISSLIEAEGPGFGEEGKLSARDITFHSRSTDSKRWSPSTSIGDFLRDAARIGSFVVRIKPPKSLEEGSENKKAEPIGPRNILVSVPSFEDRTKFLRSTLYSKTTEIERLAKLKADCDALARTGTRRFAIAGGFLLGGWWVTVFSITFMTDLGWDVAEPVTYLCGLGTLMCGYTWFLVHNREVSYRAVLSETTTRRQQKLYFEKGFNLERYEDLIDECKELRKHIKKVAEDYDLEWEQGKGSSGHNKRALDVVRKREAQDRAPRVAKSEEEEEEEEGKSDEKERDQEREEEEEEGRKRK